MKYLKRAGIYKASNVTFDPKSVSAYSYGWWRFVDVVNGKVVFNNYSYSNSTCKHQHKVRSLMNELGIKIDLYISVPCSLTGNLRYGQSANVGIEALKNAYRTRDLVAAKEISKVFKVKFTQDEIQQIYTEVEEKLCDEFLLRSVKRQEKQDAEYERQLSIITKIAQERKLQVVDIDGSTVVDFGGW
jgi:hypothetical protein